MASFGAKPDAKPIRKRLQSEESDEEGGQVNVAALNELREQQRYRTKALGVNSDKLMSTHETKATPNVSLEDESSKSVTELNSGLSNFQSGGQHDADPLEAAKQEYVKKRLRELRGEVEPRRKPQYEDPPAPSKNSAENLNAEDLLANPDKLYSLPCHLRHIPASRGMAGRGSAVVGQDGANGGGDVEGGTGTGGMMLSGTGISEVALPLEWKARNVAETERAMSEYLARKREQESDAEGIEHSQGRDGAGSMLSMDASSVGNVAANYAQHRKEYARQGGQGHGRKDTAEGAGKQSGVGAGAGAGTAIFDARAVPLSLHLGHTSSDGAGVLAQQPSSGSNGKGDGSGHGHASDNTAFARFRQRELSSLRSR